MTKRLLIVDDEIEICEFLKSFFEDRDFEVAVANGGSQALEKAATFHPEVVLLDIQMPLMNGYTFIMEKVKIPEYVNIPVIVLTAYNEMEPLFRRHNVKAYLLKPLKLQDLIAKVIEIIGQP